MLTAGVLSKVLILATEAQLAATAASGGTGPYTQQWYRSTTSGFTPGGGTLISGATALTLDDTGLIPGTQYYYKVRYTDTGHSNDIVDSAQLSVLTSAPSQSSNQFAMTSILGNLDLRYNPDTVPAQIDNSEAGTLYAGQAVKLVDNAGGVPKVVACSANSDQVFGFINFSIKDKTFIAGSRAEISLDQNVMHLYATAAIARGAQVCLDITTVGGVRSLASASSGDCIVGFAYDQAAAAGSLIRVKLNSPSFQFKA